MAGMCSRYDDAGYCNYFDEQHTNAYHLARRMIYNGGVPAMWRRDTLLPSTIVTAKTKT